MAGIHLRFRPATVPVSRGPKILAVREEAFFFNARTARDRYIFSDGAYSFARAAPVSSSRPLENQKKQAKYKV